jgi:hypothetical protein
LLCRLAQDGRVHPSGYVVRNITGAHGTESGPRLRVAAGTLGVIIIGVSRSLRPVVHDPNRGVPVLRCARLRHIVASGGV